MPVSRDDVSSLFWNLLRRPPGEADLQAHCRASSVADLAKDFAESHEFLVKIVEEAFRWWLKRPATPNDVINWVNNLRRLGQVEGLKHIASSAESLSHCIDPGQPGSIVPPSDFWSGTQFGNALIRWWKNREPREPKEGLRYALQVHVGNGVFPGLQMYDMVAQEPDSIRLRIQRNYTSLLGREITPHEYQFWNTLAANSIWVWQIAASPEGLVHGLSLSRQRGVEGLPCSNIPPAPEAVAEQPPLDYFGYSGAPGV